MKTFTDKELKEILRSHELYLNDDPKGIRADLSNTDLSSAYLTNANLSGANLSGADLSDVYLSSAYLTNANLNNANLSGAYLSDADLRYVDLSSAYLTNANLTNANLNNANLSGASLCGANLTNAYLTNAYLNNANLTNANLSDAILCGAILGNNKDLVIEMTNILKDHEGKDLIGYKKAVIIDNDNEFKCKAIVKLQIPKDAKRSNATSNKCRCSYAKVIDITPLDNYNLQENDKCVSIYNRSFAYVVNKEVISDKFDENRFNECSNGIHFFLNEKDAIEY